MPPLTDSKTHVQRLATVCGAAFSEAAIALEHQSAGLKLWGWAASPNFSRNQADLQYFYVNGRLIRDKALSHAVKLAYQDVLMHGRYPAVVLFLEVEPQAVDVNVHPTKAEVRFQDAQAIHAFIRRSLQKTLAKLPQAAAPVVPIHQASIDKSALDTGWDWQPKQQPMPFRSAQPLVEVIASTAGPAIPAVPDTAPPIPAATGPIPETEAENPPLGYALAQLHGIYILAQNQVGLIVVDAHASHERILYEKLKAERASGGIQTQALLLPVSLGVTSQEADLAEAHAALFTAVS